MARFCVHLVVVLTAGPSYAVNQAPKLCEPVGPLRFPAVYLHRAKQFTQKKQKLEAARCYEVAGQAASSKRARREHTYSALEAYFYVMTRGSPATFRPARTGLRRAGVRFLSEHPHDEQWPLVAFNVGRAELELGGDWVRRGSRRMTALARKYPGHKLAEIAVWLVIESYYEEIAASRTKASKRMSCRRLKQVAIELLRANIKSTRKHLQLVTRLRSCRLPLPSIP